MLGTGLGLALMLAYILASIALGAYAGCQRDRR